MGKASTAPESVTGNAVKIAVASVLLCGLLYLLDVNFGILALLDLVKEDVQMMAVCAVLFCVLWVSLNSVLIGPYVRLATAREQATTGAESESVDLERQAEDLLYDYENRIHEARKTAARERQEIVGAAKNEAAEILQKAQGEGQEIIKQARQEIASRQSEIRNEAAGEAEKLSSVLVEKLMNSVVFILIMFSAVLFSAIAPEFSYAATPGHGGHHAPSFSDLTFYLINFSVYFAVAAFMFKRSAPGAWAARRERISAAVNAAGDRVKLAEEKLRAARQKTSAVESDAKNIIDTTKEDAGREAQDILAAAGESAARIISQARDTAAAENKAFERAVRKTFAEMALKLAEEKLKSRVTYDSDKKLRDKTRTALKDLVVH